MPQKRAGTFWSLGISYGEDHFKIRTEACFDCVSSVRVDCEVDRMLNLVVTLLIIALIAAVLGFGGIAMAAVGLAKIIFFVALLLFLIAVLAGSLRAV
jgi:uncharacterized membrane protein YtjA (UPF0391 family)